MSLAAASPPESVEVFRIAVSLQWMFVEPHSEIDLETIEDALDVLRDLVLWDMSPERWDHVAGILQRLTVALSRHDVDELRASVAELELSGPVKASRIGSATTASAPEPVVERQVMLVHALVLERGHLSSAESNRYGDPANGGHGADRAH
jgi:hypothetical protein